MDTRRAPVSHLAPASVQQENYRPALVLVTSLFFMWGLITSLNDILIPHLKAVFTLSYLQAMLVQFCFFAAYFVMSFPAGYLVARLGYKNGIVTGLAVAGIGCLIFYPAAGLRSYPLFLGALFVLASGITLLQVSANPYVTVLGTPDTAASRLNMTQAFNSLGTTLGPFLGALLILSVAVRSAGDMQSMTPEQLSAYATTEAGAVQLPYLGLAALLFVIAFVIARSRLPAMNAGDAAGDQPDGTVAQSHHDSVWAHRPLVLGAVGIFVYVGAEVSIGSFLVNFMGRPEIAGLSESDAGKYLSLYWGGAMVGRFIGVAILAKFRPGHVLALNAFIVTALLLVAMVFAGRLAMWMLLLVGLFNSIMFPTIFTLAIKGLGELTSKGAGVLCMAIVGGAFVPLIQGFCADYIGVLYSFSIPLACYLYIAFYGLRGCRPTR
ncbi:L-fucose:H+ symporter permease [Noviherbaspirillum suwonense]|jgi:FHS family L-fucose permease-like MFS transporter|uniref:MFS transporter, FHS family, L-fucose permease n=1 Tax=Noviherbaspirillum suwonense TaxID=1224511 RepID=A0ABY1QTU9_9BURK|nr:L-fucose:H+ symporter permease [Noviherbaspirillum suwonense]SMP79724.1 MFS transporter, FHS family, L-fucose permease [Noviherbaspirillum suwonense]